MSRSRSPSKKYLKISCTNGESHLSNLPDGIISEILSCLPTKDAVRTSVLSKDWEYKWTYIDNVDIDDKMLFSTQRTKKTSFVNFVERILLLSQNVKSFRLSCSETYECSRLTTLMDAVLRRNVESFEVNCLQYNIVLPRSLLSCASLRELKLNLPCTFRVPSKNCFPNLTSLYLKRVKIRNELSYTDPLEFTFPALENFELTECNWLNVKYVEIYAPALIMFICLTPFTFKLNDYSIKIRGASLVKFESSGYSLENIVLTGSTVAYAIVDRYRSPLDGIEELENTGLQFRLQLKEFKGLKKWELSTSIAKAIALSKHGAPLPIFNELEQLVLSDLNNIEALLELLHAAPYLKFLIINLGFLQDCDYDVIESVPSCILSHLEDVKFYCFHGTERQLKLAKFLLKNAMQLTKVHFFSSDTRFFSAIGKKYFLKKLSTLPKCSARLKFFVN